MSHHGHGPSRAPGPGDLGKALHLERLRSRLSVQFLGPAQPRYKNLNYWSTLKLVLASLSVDSCVECLADKCIYIYICMYVRLQDLQVLGTKRLRPKVPWIFS